MVDTPVLFNIFNRPETVCKVFEVIRTAAPKQLFIAADGPRPGKGEEEKCKEARSIVSQIDWDCEVHTLFRDQNFGCGMAISEAITWFFNYVEQGIILEDDCLPEPEFFPFCSQLLEKYKNADRVMEVSGLNMLEKTETDASYFFSGYDGTWGWATWRRAWQKYDFNMGRWQNEADREKILIFLKDENLTKYWTAIFNKTFQKEIDTWDYQWLFARIINDGIGIIPAKNMIRNIGFGPNATHTFNEKAFGSQLKTYTINFPLVHPSNVDINRAFDKKLSEAAFYKKPSVLKKIKSLLINQ